MIHWKAMFDAKRIAAVRTIHRYQQFCITSTLMTDIGSLLLFVVAVVLYMAIYLKAIVNIIERK